MFKTIVRALIVGIGVGVLLAPRAGSETRRLLSEKLNRFIDTTGNMGDDLSPSASEAGDNVVPKQHSVDAGAAEPSEVGSSEPRPM